MSVDVDRNGAAAIGGVMLFGPDDQLLTGAQVAEMFRVAGGTVTRWGRDGRLQTITTMGGHYRYSKTEVEYQVAMSRGGV